MNVGVECTQCGMTHPSLKVGEICPILKGRENLEKASGQETEDGTKLDYTDILATLTTILTSQISSKGIKDITKIKQYLIIELTKALENYTE